MYFKNDCCVVVFCICTLWMPQMVVVADQYEMQLIHDLLHNYNSQERPVVNFADAIDVNMKIQLQQIVGLEEKKEELSTNMWLQFSWNDYKLKWNPYQYNNVTDTRLPAFTAWQPDIILYNSAESNFISVYPSNQVVYSDGTINWIPPGILRSRCALDITWFPFDEQNCHLKFGSWTYPTSALNLKIDYAKFNDSSPIDTFNAMDTSDYITNGEWSLIGTPAVLIERDKSCCRAAPYSYIKFYLRIRRRTWYYGFNLIIPSTLISLMTVLGFTLPPDACEKVTLEITILLTVSYLLSVIANETPVTSTTVPLIGTFFNCCLILVSASVVFTVTVLNLHFRSRDTHEMSAFMRYTLLVWLPWLVMMRRPGMKFNKQLLNDKQLRDKALAHTTREDYASSSRADSPTLQSELVVAAASNENLDDLHSNVVHVAKETDQILDQRVQTVISALFTKGALQNEKMGALLTLTQSLLAQLKAMTVRLENEDADDDAANDWRYAAMAVDRLCLFFFLLFIVFSTCGIMFSAPHLVA